MGSWSQARALSAACLLAFAAVGGIAMGCASTPIPYSILDRLVSENVALAQAHLAHGEPLEHS